MSEGSKHICPQCEEDVYKAREALGGKQLTFCPRCKFPLLLIAGKYRLEQVLAEGGYGVVYKAHHIYLADSAPRVVKLLRPEVLKLPRIRERFIREVKLTAELSQHNEHIVRIYDDFGIIPNLGPFYVMEYLEGKPLDSFLTKKDKLPSRSFCLHIFEQLCQTMYVAHTSGVVHRDLKPENLMVIERGDDPYFLKVLDFGIAKPINEDELRKSQQMTQGILGTPYYMSPEQCINQHVDERSDIYSLGCILYQMFTGYAPFQPYLPEQTAPNMIEIIQAHLSKMPVSPDKIQPERVSEELSHVILRALSKKPEDRYSSAAELWDDVRISCEPKHLVDLSSSVLLASPYSAADLPVCHTFVSPSGTRLEKPTGSFVELPSYQSGTHPNRSHSFLAAAPTPSNDNLFRSPGQSKLVVHRAAPGATIDHKQKQNKNAWGQCQPKMTRQEERVQGDLREDNILQESALDQGYVAVNASQPSLPQNTWQMTMYRTTHKRRTSLWLTILFVFLGGSGLGAWLSKVESQKSKVESRKSKSKSTKDSGQPGAPKSTKNGGQPGALAPGSKQTSTIKSKQTTTIKPNLKRTTTGVKPVGACGSTPCKKQTTTTKRHIKKRRRVQKRRIKKRRRVRLARIRRRVVRARVPVMRPKVVLAKVAKQMTPLPVAGCPAMVEGMRWVRFNLRSSASAARITFLQGRGKIRRRNKGFCLLLQSRVQLRIDAPDRRPCVLSLAFRHKTYRILLQQEKLDDIETSQNYCISR